MNILALQYQICKFVYLMEAKFYYFTNITNEICASWDTNTVRRDRTPGPIPEKVYRQAPSELACIRPAIQKIIGKEVKACQE